MEALGLDRRDLYDMIGTRTFADDRPEEPEEPADLVRAPAESGPRATAVDLAIEDQRALHGSLRQRDWASLVLLTVGACFVAALISAALLFAAPGSVSYGAILAGVVPAIGTLVLMLAEVERRRALQLAEGIQALRMKLDPSGGRDPGPSPLMARFNLRGHPSLALAATVTLLLTSASAVVGLVSLAQHAHWVAFALFAALSAATIAGSAVASRWVILHVGFARARADEVADKLRR
jgi:hypothetical protein